MLLVDVFCVFLGVASAVLLLTTRPAVAAPPVDEIATYMGAFTNWLIDKSAYTRLSTSRDATTWIERNERGLVRISTVTWLEIGYSLRTGLPARKETRPLR